MSNTIHLQKAGSAKAPPADGRRAASGSSRAASRASAVFVRGARAWLGATALALIVPAVLIAAWWAVVRAGLVEGTLLPAPVAVAEEVGRLWSEGTLQDHVFVTSLRVAQGFLFGVLAATLFGVLTGYSRLLRTLLDPTLQALKAVPSLAWVPLFILWFGIFETSKVTLIAVGVFFPVYLNLMEGIQNVDRKLVEVGHTIGLPRFQLIRHILLPATLPAFFVGLRAGLALGWMFVIAAELMGASEGLGFLMVDGQMTSRPAQIIASLILFAVIGKFTDALLAAAGRRVLHWQDTFGRKAGGEAHA